MSKNQTHYTPDGKLYKGGTHKVGGTLMTGAKHTPTSKVLTHTPPKKRNENPPEIPERLGQSKLGNQKW